MGDDGHGSRSAAPHSRLRPDLAGLGEDRLLEHAREGLNREHRIEREFEPEAVQRIKDNAATDLLVGGAALAAVALKAGLVDEVHLFVVPMVVGGGKRALPDRFRQKLELLDEHRFGNGTVFLRYRTV